MCLSSLVESDKCRCTLRYCLLGAFYVNDLNYLMRNWSLRVYGDDTTEYASDPLDPSPSPSPSPSGLAADLSVLSSLFECKHWCSKSASVCHWAIAIWIWIHVWKFCNDQTFAHTDFHAWIDPSNWTWMVSLLVLLRFFSISVNSGFRIINVAANIQLLFTSCSKSTCF